MILNPKCPHLPQLGYKNFPLKCKTAILNHFSIISNEIIIIIIIIIIITKTTIIIIIVIIFSEISN